MYMQGVGVEYVYAGCRSRICMGRVYEHGIYM